MTKHPPETLEDFIFLDDKGNWEAELRALLDEPPALKDSRLILERFKAAWKSGMTAIEASQVAASKHDPGDVAEAIAELQLQQLASDWSLSYGLKIDPQLLRSSITA